MARPPSIQMIRYGRADGSVTFSLRVRVAGGDETLLLGNTSNGWDEMRAERARQQLLAKIELGLWNPGGDGIGTTRDEEPSFAELATDWFADRERNPAIRESTTNDDRWRLSRYLVPFFGKLRPSQITPMTVKQYRRHIHKENEYIRAARNSGRPLVDPRTGQGLRPLSNESINKTLRTLAAVLDEAEDVGWVTRNVARGRRTREPVERRRAEALEIDEFLALLEAAHDLDRAHKPATVERAREVRRMRDELDLSWNEITAQLELTRGTALRLYELREGAGVSVGPRRAIIATLGLAGPRVSELCALDWQDVDLINRRIHIRDAKTPAGVRTIDIRPRLFEELRDYTAELEGPGLSDPFFPTRTGARRDRNNVLNRVVAPVLARANQLRAERDQLPILTRVTPHTFRRTFITFMLAAGFDVPYVQDQVGHTHPSTTLAVYARVIRRSDRDALRAELRDLFGDDRRLLEPSLPEPEHLDARRRDDQERGGMER